MDSGELLTRWSVRVAVVLFVASLASRARAKQLSRIAWTLGCAAYLVHVAAAFHYYHHWSHDAAYEATARQTRETTGLDFGGGLYANDAFTAIWLVDAAWWWVAKRSYENRSHAVSGIVLGFMGFIACNATVVFATGFSRWLGVAACLLLTPTLLWRPKGKVDADRANQRCPSLDRGDDR